ncbi:hypothetical protein NDU88_006488 [Pleurodeles waltl]|uniref:Uncharacterized protein n=1 Tax=Pleurodeles waltl TaxID=8319 RepID=A0AAV7MMG4_PLEWA|nr:hypothetical protein NDU88_006488 [Pleurodeles waltl]
MLFPRGSFYGSRRSVTSQAPSKSFSSGTGRGRAFTLYASLLGCPVLGEAAGQNGFARFKGSSPVLPFYLQHFPPPEGIEAVARHASPGRARPDDTGGCCGCYEPRGSLSLKPGVFKNPQYIGEGPG